MSIRQGVPLPPYKTQPRWTPIIRRMKRDESFLVRDYMRPGEVEEKLARCIEIAAVRCNVHLAKRTTEQGIAYWRTK